MTLELRDRGHAVAAAPSARWHWILVTFAVWTISIAVAAFCWGFANHGIHGLDAHAYWAAARRTHLYTAKPGALDAYLYSPAFTTVLHPLAMLPADVFVGVWMAAEAATFVWLLRPLGVRWSVPAFCLCMPEIIVGNIYAFLAVVAVIGSRRPAAWALPVLTKITPGLGPVWFAARREWRKLAVSLAVTIAIAVVSVALTPAQWADWITFLTAHSGENQLLLPARVAAAVALTAYAARRRSPWLVPIGMLIANPMVFHSEMALTLLAALPRTIRQTRSGDPT